MIASIRCDWRRLVAVIIRYTGLRKGTVMQIRWQDVDLDAATLHIAFDKSRAVQGRTVPIPQHLVDELAKQGRRVGWVVWGRTKEVQRRDCYSEYFRRRWRESGVDPERWQGHPLHCLRAAYNTELLRLGADPAAVDYLMGHSLPGNKGAYVGPAALRLDDAVGRIKKIQLSQSLPLPFLSKRVYSG